MTLLSVLSTFQSSPIHIQSSTLTPHTWTKVEYFKLTSQHVLATRLAFIVDWWTYPSLRKNKEYLNHIPSSKTLTSFTFKLPFRKETLYFRLFTLTNFKVHNPTLFASNNLTNIPTSYECTRGTHWLSSDLHWSILQTPSMILHSSIHQENKNNFKSTSTSKLVM